MKQRVFEDPRILARKNDMGKVSDTQIAKEIGVPVDWVRRARVELGIDAYARTDEGMRIRER